MSDYSDYSSYDENGGGGGKSKAVFGGVILVLLLIGGGLAAFFVQGNKDLVCEKGFKANLEASECENINECNNNPCGKDAECKDTAGSFTCECKDGKVFDDKGLNCIDPTNCKDILDGNPGENLPSKPYKIFIGGKELTAYCDMKTDGGGWTVIQRRISNSDFAKYWNDYAMGFGDINTNHWLGLEHVSALTHMFDAEFRADLTTVDDKSAYAYYSHFKVADASDKYRLSVSGYKGTAGNALEKQDGGSFADGIQFSTRDQDNDNNKDRGCSQVFGDGGNWYNACFKQNLNGPYDPEKCLFTWNDFKTGERCEDLFGNSRSALKGSKMMIRPKK